MYEFKRLQEYAWAGIVAALVFGLQVLVEFDPDKVTDWKAWAIALGAGMVRAVAGALLSKRVVSG